MQDAAALLPDAAVTIRFAGKLDLAAMGKQWRQTLRTARAAQGHPLVLDLTSVTQCDTAGATLLQAAEAAHGGPAELRGAPPDTLALLAQVRKAAASPAPRRAPAATDILAAGLADVVNAIAFTGEVAVAAVRAPARRRMFPGRDLLSFIDTAGVGAISLVLLLGFLMGLILAFQSSIPLRRFGAEIFIVNLVAISLLRELGPLLTAVILAGRTGSAYAAELGTMVVNDEVAAIQTMGIDPVTMLVLPRLAACMLVVPGLTLLLEVSGLIGMAVVMRVLGFPPVAVLNQVLLSVRLSDLFGGLLKAVCFGGAVAMIGCRRGLGAGLGPRAVGQAATAAVVGGIFSTILLDGVFTILYYRLGF